MGCKECKQKNKQTQEGSTDTINKTMEDGSKKSTYEFNWIPDNIDDVGDTDIGNFFWKLFSFVIILAALPFIMVILIVKVFFHLFLPNVLVNAGNKLWKFSKDKLIKIITWVAIRRQNKEMKKREKQFTNNPSYDDLEIFEYPDSVIDKDNNDAMKDE